MKHYDALTCHADRETLDLLIALGGNLPITGMLDNETSVVLYFDGGLSEETIEQIRSWLPEGAALERTRIEEQNWNAEFEQSLEPVRIADGLIITQSWHPVADARPDDLVVTIDPKMSFGTGHHESTRLIARLMTGLDFAGRRVLDAGTGTGVLAIVAAKRGADRVLAFDNNEWAVENTRENLELNGVADRVETVLGEIGEIEEGAFDIILANMHRNIIIQLLPEITAKLGDREGLLLTSGVLIEDYDSLLDAARAHGLEPLRDERENEWVATVFSSVKF